MTVAYRILSGSDVPLLEELLAVFGEAFGEPQTYQVSPPDRTYLQSLLAKDHVVALVALEDASVVGGLVAYVLEKFEQKRSEVYIYDLAVSPTHRRRGIARGLINALKAVARERGAYVIFVQADPQGLPAIRLYAALGLREDVHHFDIPVADLLDTAAARRSPRGSRPVGG